MKAILLLTLLVILKPSENTTIMGSAPFCKVDRGGFIAQCYYYSMDSCRSSLFNGEFCIMR